MNEPRDLRDLVGEDVPAAELEALAHADALLRSVPAPPAHVPPSLTGAVSALPLERRVFTRRRLAVAVALAAALAAGFFGLGRWTSAPDDQAFRTTAMRATVNAPGAAAAIRMGGLDAKSGNWTLELDVSGLPKLRHGESDYYVLWLAKDGEYAATCGNFNVGPGTTTVKMTVSYRLAEYDAWVISRHGDDTPWLLRAPVKS